MLAVVNPPWPCCSWGWAARPQAAQSQAQVAPPCIHSTIKQRDGGRIIALHAQGTQRCEGLIDAASFASQPPAHCPATQTTTLPPTAGSPCNPHNTAHSRNHSPPWSCRRQAEARAVANSYQLEGCHGFERSRIDLPELPLHPHMAMLRIHVAIPSLARHE